MAFYQYQTGEVYDYSFEPSNDEAVKLSNKAGKVARQKYCCRELRKLIKPGSTVYTILRNVSASGMSRQIDVIIVKRDGPRNISNYVADACGYTQHNGGPLKVGGCGMDMGFAVVYGLGAKLWPNGTSKPHSRRNGEPDSDGGYALRQEWI
jgi:hypothetical protein